AAKAELTESFQRFLWDYIERPRFEDEQLLGKVYAMLFTSCKNDPTVKTEKLARVVRGLAEHPWGWPGTNTADGALALADRGVALDVAEETARKGAALVERRLAEDK